jgi:hypothetical protein
LIRRTRESVPGRLLGYYWFNCPFSADGFDMLVKCY